MSGHVRTRSKSIATRDDGASFQEMMVGPPSAQQPRDKQPQLEEPPEESQDIIPELALLKILDEPGDGHDVKKEIPSQEAMKNQKFDPWPGNFHMLQMGPKK
uniref:GAGE domain-containing protein n=1 Tax=Sus scrofa TaxID=9823 RepID=A0A8D0UB78_PIG